MKKILALILTTFMLLSLLTACGSEDAGEAGNDSTSASGTGSDSSATVTETNTEDGKKVLKVGISGVLETLNPFAALQTGQWAVRSAYYEFLAYYNEDNSDITPWLAKGWTTEDGKVYDVEIWDNIYDWNGNHITADDVIYCFTYSRDEMANSQLVGVTFEKIDDYKVRFVMADNFIMNFQIAVSNLAIISQKEFEASTDQMATSCVGTGAYKISEFVPGSSITLVKNENYWQTDENRHFRATAEADEIQVITIKEDAQVAIALETGAIDAAKIPVASASRFIEDPNYDAYTASSTAYYYLLFNTATDSIFYNNAALRKAIAYGINVDEIIAGAYDGYAGKLKEIGLSGQPGYQAKWDEEDYFDQDLEKAAALLEEAGYKPGELTIDLLILQNDVNNAWATIIQAQLAQIGITVNVVSEDSAMWYNDYMNGNFQICGFNIVQVHIANTIAMANGYSKWYTKETTPFMTEPLEDEHMQELCYEILHEETCTDEAMDEIHEYAMEKCYVYGLAYPLQYSFVAKSANIKSIGYAHNYILVPNTFTFN